MLIYKCDCCGKQFDNDDSLLTIGSSSGQDLKIENKIFGAKVISMGRYTDRHFCSKECLANFFFNPEEKQPHIYFGDPKKETSVFGERKF